MTKAELEAAIAVSDRKWHKAKITNEKRRAFLAQQHLDLTIKLLTGEYD